MTEADEPSGQDLARQALASWKAARKNAPATQATKTRRKRSRAQYGDGRDPVGLGSVLEQLEAEREWKTGVKGGGLADRWAEWCPELVGKVAPQHFDAATGRLDLRPASPTYAAHLRLLGQQLIARLQAQEVPVRSIRVLAPGALPESASLSASDPAAPEDAPIKTRDDACAGYHVAIAAHQAHATKRPDTAIQQRTRTATEEQTRAMRAHRESEEANRDAYWFTRDLEETAAADNEKTRQAAIQRARAQKAGHIPDVRTAFQHTA